MAKRKLSWVVIDVHTSKGLDKLLEAETKAKDATDAEIRKRVAKAKGVPSEQVKIGRNFGKISYAIDDQAPAAAVVESL